jgi:hypothetical protein
MVGKVAKPRTRLTQIEALEQARARIQAEKATPKPKRVAGEDSPGPRDREQWITLPKHLSTYVGEQGVIHQGRLWVRRIDRLAARTDAHGVKHTPVRQISLGPADVLDPNYQRKNNGPGQQTTKGAKTPDFVLDSKASRSERPPARNRGGFGTPWRSTPKGRPR